MFCPRRSGRWRNEALGHCDPLRTVTGAITGGMAPKNAEHFDTHEDLAHVLRTRAAEGDVLLFKGSRGMKMEQALHLFLDEEK